MLPASEEPLLVRTDRSDDAVWDSLLEAVRTPSPEGFLANVRAVDDPTFDDASVADVLGAIPNREDHAVLFIADRGTMGSPELPILVVGLFEGEGSFRVVPSELWGVENNLSLGNMDFEEFAEGVDEDGVFRGFPRF